jgi:hypothetical protein
VTEKEAAKIETNRTLCPIGPKNVWLAGKNLRRACNPGGNDVLDQANQLLQVVCPNPTCKPRLGAGPFLFINQPQRINNSEQAIHNPGIDYFLWLSDGN